MLGGLCGDRLLVTVTCLTPTMRGFKWQHSRRGHNPRLNSNHQRTMSSRFQSHVSLPKMTLDIRQSQRRKTERSPVSPNHLISADPSATSLVERAKVIRQNLQYLLPGGPCENKGTRISDADSEQLSAFKEWGNWDNSWKNWSNWKDWDQFSDCW